VIRDVIVSIGAKLSLSVVFTMSTCHIVKFVARKVEEQDMTDKGKEQAVAHLKGFAEGIDVTSTKLSFEEGGFLQRICEFEKFVFDGDVLEDHSFTFVLPLIAARQACQDKTIRAHANLFDHHEKDFLRYWCDCYVEVAITEDEARFSIVRDSDISRDVTAEVEITYSTIEEKYMQPSTGCAYSDLGICGLRMSGGTHVFCVGGGRTTYKEFMRSKTEIAHSHQWVVWDVQAKDLKKNPPGKRTSALVGEAGVLVL
jgi:hypothetical protein